MKFNCRFLELRCLIVLVLLVFVLCGFSFAKADLTHPETLSQSDYSERAIWNIQGRHGTGTGFFIGENHFITNLHVVNMLFHQSSFEDMSKNHGLENQNPMNHVVLEQKENTSVLKIKKIVSISALHDLVLLETEEDVTDYLDLREYSPESGEDFFLIAYPGGILTKIRKIRDIFYEDSLEYSFSVNLNHSSLAGASGSPLLDEQGLVTGVIRHGGANSLSVIKINHLRRFITGNIGVKCSDFIRCMKKEIENLKNLAEQGYAPAQLKLDLMDSAREMTKKFLGELKSSLNLDKIH